VVTEGRDETGRQRGAVERPNVLFFHVNNLGVDVPEGWTSVERAKTYGVVLDPIGEVDHEAGRAERAPHAKPPLDDPASTAS
jgi:hypothetical protein